MKIGQTQQNTTFGNKIVCFPGATSRACEKAKTMLVKKGEIALENLGPAVFYPELKAVLVLDKSTKDSSTQCAIENYPELRAKLRGLPKKSEGYRIIKKAYEDILDTIMGSSKQTDYIQSAE